MKKGLLEKKVTPQILAFGSVIKTNQELMKTYYQNTECSIIGTQYKTVMDEICTDLLDKTSNSFHELLLLEQITFAMFLISFCTIGMFRPVEKKSKEEIE
jgi:hypothetical protein